LYNISGIVIMSTQITKNMEFMFRCEYLFIQPFEMCELAWEGKDLTTIGIPPHQC